MVGVDIVKVKRFEKYAGNLQDTFVQRVFTEREIEYLAKKAHQAQTMAGIFAAKEAVAKAIGTGFRGFQPRDIEILHKQNGKPYAVLHNGAKKAAKRAFRSRRLLIHVSISHTDTDAVAVCRHA
jgi:phosphopantetheine--protein transferase-like protein